MGVFTAFDIAASGMSAERYRMDIITQKNRGRNTVCKEGCNISGKDRY